ncbi:sensor histidine kinase [Nocardioides conyzicola]|uniref:histidine kinase n=1 Tax=Nocardioides conyzicola TaxID=1651781 RepID=A0ABP8XU56_9ACTN
MGTLTVYDPALDRARVAGQRLFAVVVIVVVLAVLVGLPPARSSVSFWIGCAAVAVATVATVALPWRRLPPLLLAAVPAVDILAVALLRVDLMPTMAAAGVLAAIPALWLGADFGRTGVAIATVGGLAIFLMPALAGPWVLGTGADVARLFLWQLQTTGLALLAHAIVDELRRRDLLGKAVLTAVGSGVVVYDARGRLVLANGPAWSLAELGGYDLRLPGRPSDRAWTADRTHLAPEQQALGRACQVEHLPDTIEWLGPERDPSPVGWSARRMYDDDGDVLGTVVVCHDLTATLASRRSQEQFLGTITHELRTPLTSIVGFVDVAESLCDQDDRLLMKSLSAIRRNSDQLLTLVGRLLHESEDHLDLQPRRVDLGELLMSVLGRWRTQCTELGLRLETDLAPGVLVDVDPHQIVRVIDALVSNATKFTPSGGDVRVRLEVQPGHVLFEVTDTGIGMSSADRARAFDRFHRGDAARVQAIQGMGLGLQTVKKVVEAHHGSVDLDSLPGQGTTVRVRVPESQGALAG